MLNSPRPVGSDQAKVAMRKLPPQLTLKATARPVLSTLVMWAPERERESDMPSKVT